MKTYTFTGDKSWNYIGRFYGIDPLVLAAYNGKRSVDITQPIEKGFKLKIPNAADLTTFYPEFKKLFGQMTDSRINLAPPTVVDIYRETQDRRVRAGSGAVLGMQQAIVPQEGNMVVVNAARMRRFSHTGDNYQNGQPLRSLNPEHEGNNGLPDATLMKFAVTWWKCNVMVGDVMTAAGFHWPMSEFKRYLQPTGLMQAMAKSNQYTTPIWVAKRFENGRVNKAVPLESPKLADWSKVLPGDVLLLHADGGDLPGHSGIITSRPQLDEDGDLTVRLVDIYGETWIKVDEHRVAAVVRAKWKRPVPEQSVGGDPNNTAKMLDKVDAELPINDESIGDELFRVVE